jgi:hypothetical protein
VRAQDAMRFCRYDELAESLSMTVNHNGLQCLECVGRE